MTKTYKKSHEARVYVGYSKRNLEKALAAINNGATFRTASKRFNIPLGTLSKKWMESTTRKQAGLLSYEKRRKRHRLTHSSVRWMGLSTEHVRATYDHLLLSQPAAKKGSISPQIIYQVRISPWPSWNALETSFAYGPSPITPGKERLFRAQSSKNTSIT